MSLDASAGKWMSPADCLQLRIPDLGVAILRRLCLLGEADLNSRSFVEGTVDGPGGWFYAAPPISTSIFGLASDRREERQKLKMRLYQAWSWLESQGYVVVDPTQSSPNWKQLTPEGEAIASDPDADAALRRAKAANQLSIDLHPRLVAAGVQQTFRAGDLDSAIRDAFADLEHSVRTLAGLTSGDFGVKLMSKAFAKSGPLAPGINSRQQAGLQKMFEGAFSILRNPAGHGPTGLEVEEAVEQVLHADLLMRKLDEVATVLGKSL
jgi:hypothetical protein